MYMLKVDGVILPTPSGYMPGIMELSDAERNTKGDMFKDFIAMKNKLELNWKALTQTELTILTNVKRKPSFNLEFISMETGLITSGKFYAGDITANAMDFKNGRVSRWLDVKMNFVEM